VKSTVRTLGELGLGLVLAPERHLSSSRATSGVPLGELVTERGERALPPELARAMILDTTHAKDGVIDVRSAARDGAGARSAKKRARAGDLLVSRLRPYLRQIALVHEGALPSRRVLCVSTEFYVLTPRSEGDDLAYLLPFLLCEETQELLASAQEGGHHPRVPRDSLFALRVPHALVASRARTSRRVRDALGAHYLAARALAALLR
jgi:hypothetical protein